MAEPSPPDPAPVDDSQPLDDPQLAGLLAAHAERAVSRLDMVVLRARAERAAGRHRRALWRIVIILPALIGLAASLDSWLLQPALGALLLIPVYAWLTVARRRDIVRAASVQDGLFDSWRRDVRSRIRSTSWASVLCLASAPAWGLLGPHPLGVLFAGIFLALSACFWLVQRERLKRELAELGQVT